MGFVKTVGAAVGLTEDVTGVTDQRRAAESAARTQAESGEAAILRQEEAAQRAQGFFEPFAGVAEQGAAGASFLTDPQERFDFLQDNPLFDLALENANQRTLQSASANRRLSFGDTLQQLSNNVLLASQPLLANQDRNRTNLLNIGSNIAGNRANIETGLGAGVSDLTTGIGSSLSAGQIAAGGAQAQGFKNLIDITGAIGGAFAGGGAV